MITPSSKSIQNYNYPQSPLCLKYPSWRHYSPLCISVIFHTKFITRVSSSSKFQLSYVTAHLKSRSQLHARKLHKRVTWQKHQCFSVNFLWKNKWHISELKECQRAKGVWERDKRKTPAYHRKREVKKKRVTHFSYFFLTTSFDENKPNVHD